MKRGDKAKDKKAAGKAAATFEPVELTPLDRFREMGLPVACVAGVWTGWNAYQGADLLEGVLRGALVWAGALALWMIGAALCGSLLQPASQPIPDPSGTNQENPAAEPAAATQ